MAKINIEVELDWLEEGMSLDEVLKDEILSSLKSKVTADAQMEITKKLSKVLEEETTKVVDGFLEKTLEAKIENMQIPYKKNEYGSTYEFIPISEFIGLKYEAYLNKRVLDKDGGQPRYSGDAKLSINEYFINKYLEKELTSKVSTLVQTARKDAEETVIKTLEQTLKDQLSVDIIKRLNVPEMLKALQTKAELLDNNNAK